jgi:Flp pilus assembly protein TadD
MRKHRILLMAIVVFTTSNAQNLVADEKPRSSEPNAQAIETARKAMLSGRNRMAIDALEKMSRDQPRLPEVAVILSKAYMNVGEYEKASPIVEALRANPGDAGSAEVLWEWERLHGGTEKAVTIMREAMERMSKESDDVLEFARIRATIGETLLSVGDFKDAETEFRAAIRMIDEEHAKMHQLGVPHDHARFFSSEAAVGMARIYQTTGDSNRSQRLWKTIRNRLSKCEHLAHAGFAALAAGNDRDADRAFEAAKKIATDRPADANVLTAIAIARKESPESILAKTTANLEKSKDIETLMMHAWAQALNGRNGEAAETLKSAMRFGTKDARSHYVSGLIHESAGEIDKAKAQFEAALKMNAAFDPIHSARAKAFLESSEKNAG